MRTGIIGLMTVLFFILLAFSEASAGQSYLDRCFIDAGKIYRINPEILRAIALTESGMQPYSVNLRGKSLYFEEPSKAISFVEQHLNENPDIGLMQVNYSWFKRLHIPVEYGLNPCFSIFIGAYVLKKKLNTYGWSWYGIAAYHSSKPKRNLKYAWRVYGALRVFSSQD